MSQLSNEYGRQIAFLIDRSDVVEYVIVGSNRDILIPRLERFSLIPGQLRGLRLVHTHLFGEPLTDDDLTDLALLRLDSITAICMDDSGHPISMQTATLLPPNISSGQSWQILDDTDLYNQTIPYHAFLSSLESEIKQKSKNLFHVKQKNKAIIAGVYKRGTDYEEHISELKELAQSSDIHVIDTFIQIKDRPHPKYVIGPGKLRDIVIQALQFGADFIIFDNDLNPAQAKSVTNFTEIKVIDRSQLILDIFAHRAKSNEGKLRVELAQLQYILPRLSSRDDSLSRLTGGIGGRGPGETKLEIDRRRIHDKIAFLRKKLKTIEKNRMVQKSRRRKNMLPIVSIVGYTNAGKSTLLNSMTNSEVYADNLMFATLDTSSKRIRFPEEREVIITDTVGFIRDLPKNLQGAFKSTLEELSDSDMLIHVVDASNFLYESHIKSVNIVIEELDLEEIKSILVFNKIDILSDEVLTHLKDLYPTAIFVSAFDRSTFKRLLEAIEYTLFIAGKNARIPVRDYF